MDNINKVSRVDASLGDSSYRQSHDERKAERVKTSKISFSDIYDVKMLSAQINKTSSEFKLENVEEVNRELKNVINSLEGERADNLVGGFPSEDIIELAKMMWKNN